MWQRMNLVRFFSSESALAGSRRARSASSQPRLESLEGRQLLSGIQPISNLTVPSLQGETVPLLAPTTGSGVNDPQTFTVTSSNPDIAASIAKGPFWTINISYTDPNNSSNNFTGPMTFQLFQDLTPNTVNEIQTFTNDGWYNNKWISRVASGFPNATSYIVQGGGPNRDGTGSSGQPGTPFHNENVQQLAFTGQYQLAMANANSGQGLTPPPTNDTQFFITTGQPNSELGYNYTIFGQMVTGQTILGKITQVPVTTNPGTGESNTYPVNPVNITSASLSSQNPNGVLILDTTQARVGETSTITVTSKDTLTGETHSINFTVTVGAYTGTTTVLLSNNTASLAINFRPFASVVNQATQMNVPTAVQLKGTSTFPAVPTQTATLSYKLLTQPTHGTITGFDAATGALTYTPNKNYLGPDSFEYQVVATGPLTTTPTTTISNPTLVNINVGPTATGAVTLIPPVLFVTPVPRYDHGLNRIEINQAPNPAGSGSILEVTVNGVLDSTQPVADAPTGASSVIVFGGSRAKNAIVVDPSVTVPVSLSGGNGFRTYITGGSGLSREQAWRGDSLLIAGPGTNQLLGLAGHVHFRANKQSILIFAGQPSQRTGKGHIVPPTGTYYKYVKGRLIPVGHLAKAPKHNKLSQLHTPFYTYPKS